MPSSIAAPGDTNLSDATDSTQPAMKSLRYIKCLLQILDMHLVTRCHHFSVPYSDTHQYFLLSPNTQTLWLQSNLSPQVYPSLLTFIRCQADASIGPPSATPPLSWL